MSMVAIAKDQKANNSVTIGQKLKNWIKCIAFDTLEKWMKFRTFGTLSKWTKYPAFGTFKTKQWHEPPRRHVQLVKLRGSQEVSGGAAAWGRQDARLWTQQHSQTTIKQLSQVRMHRFRSSGPLLCLTLPVKPSRERTLLQFAPITTSRRVSSLCR